METAYAQALWNMIEGGPGRAGKKPKDAVRALHEMLLRLGRANLLPKIGSIFEKIAEREHMRRSVTLSVAREKDGRAAHKAIKSIIKEMQIDAKDVAIYVDETLIGGWRLEGRERLFDASFKKYLLGMYNRATQS